MKSSISLKLRKNKTILQYSSSITIEYFCIIIANGLTFSSRNLRFVASKGCQPLQGLVVSLRMSLSVTNYYNVIPSPVHFFKCHFNGSQIILQQVDVFSPISLATFSMCRRSDERTPESYNSPHRKQINN